MLSRQRASQASPGADVDVDGVQVMVVLLSMMWGAKRCGRAPDGVAMPSGGRVR